MRINDFQHQIELIKQEVLNDDRNYVQLLQTMGNNWRYDFINQLMNWSVWSSDYTGFLLLKKVRENRNK